MQVIFHKSDKALVNKIIAKINVAYAFYLIREVKQFLRVCVIKDRLAQKLQLIYNIYIKKIAKKFYLINRKCISTPFPILKLKKYAKQAPFKQVKEYQEKVSLILYTTIIIKLNVAYATLLLSQFLINLKLKHYVIVNWTIKYLYKMRFLRI